MDSKNLEDTESSLGIYFGCIRLKKCMDWSKVTDLPKSLVSFNYINIAGNHREKGGYALLCAAEEKR